MKPSFPSTAPEQPPYFYDRCQEIVDILVKLYNPKTALVSQVDKGQIVVRAVAGNADNDMTVGDGIPYDANLFCFRVIDSRSPLFVENPAAGTVCPTTEPTINYFGCPVFLPNGEVFGTICVVEASTAEPMERVQKAIRNFRDILERELQPPAVITR